MKLQTIAALALGLAVVASAQGPGQHQGPGAPPQHPGQNRGPMGPGMPMRGPSLLISPEVIAELKLTDEQVQRLRPILRPAGARMGAPGAPPRDGRHQGPPPAGGPPQHGGPGALDEQIKTVLSPQQFGRWKQVELQIQGPGVFGRRDVSQRLEITQAQHDQIRRIHEEMRGQLPPPPGPDRDFSPQEHHNQMQIFHEKLMQRVLGVLTPEQRKQWNAMIGKPFKMQFRPPMDAPGGHRGPGGHPGGPGGQRGG